MAIFWSQLSKHVKRGNFVRLGFYLVQVLCFVVYIPFTNFSRIRYDLKAESLDPGQEKIFHSTSPNLGKVPPGAFHSFKKHTGFFRTIEFLPIFENKRTFAESVQDPLGMKYPLLDSLFLVCT